MARTKGKSTVGRCVWSEDEDGNWQTECGEMFVMLEGTPTQNLMRFCAYCGSPLREKLAR